MPVFGKSAHRHAHAFGSLNALEPEGLTLHSRRNLLKASLAGMAGLSVADLLRQDEAAAREGRSTASKKSVILLWMTGGPSHIDTWDPKPDRPLENRGPFSTIPTRIPGVRICEHLPRMAAMLDKFTVIRSVNSKRSSHEPNHVLQTGHPDAEPRINIHGRKYPAIASLVARHCGPNNPALPPYVAFRRSESHTALGGYIGRQYDPFLGNQAARLPVYTLVGENTGQMAGGDVFSFPVGLNRNRVERRQSLRRAVDALRTGVEQNPEMAALGAIEQKAVEMVLGDEARQAFDLELEPTAVRERYGKHL
ncbi:MAG: DUF1501 domain-containing protein, partial [Armatimonadetes bacterium]|nr:DUF1501 domain-containing protein [Armatimonadota bacterium]